MTLTSDMYQETRKRRILSNTAPCPHSKSRGFPGERLIKEATPELVRRQVSIPNRTGTEEMRIRCVSLFVNISVRIQHGREIRVERG